MTTATQAVYSHYDIPADPSPIAITDDDDLILLEVYRHDLIDAHAIRSLLPHRSATKIGRRLKLLRDNEYLHRLRQIERIYVQGGGSLAKAYTLGHRGAERLAERYGLPTKSRRQRERSTSLSAPYIQHGLEQTRFILQTRASAAGHDAIEFLYPDQVYERYAPHILKRSSLPNTVAARVSWHGYTEIEGTIPDGFFMLRYLNREEGKNRRSIFLEIDRGTETIDVNDRKAKTKKFWKETSILRKFLVYAYAYQTGVHRREFGIPTFQVLVVTTSPKRVREMQSMYRRRLAGRPHSVPPIRYLFTDFQTIRKHHGDILSVPIEDGGGKSRTLAQ